MSERIYSQGDDGKLEPLEESPFDLKDDLQVMIADHPELLDGEQMRPGDLCIGYSSPARKAFQIGRRQEIAGRLTT